MFKFKKNKVSKNDNSLNRQGIILFQEVNEALRAEKILKNRNYEIRLVAPPPDFRIGCDLAIEIDLIKKLEIERILKENNQSFIEILPLWEKSCNLLNIIKRTDFKNHIMVKSGNMKITFDKRTGVIVNTSGGGCPDIPFLNLSMVNKKLDECPKPSELGYTLCALMLQRALDEAIEIYKNSLKCKNNI